MSASLLETLLEFTVWVLAYVQPVYLGVQLCRNSHPPPDEVLNALLSLIGIWVLEVFHATILSYLIAVRSVCHILRILLCLYLVHPHYRGATYLYRKYVKHVVIHYGPLLDDLFLHHLDHVRKSGLMRYATGLFGSSVRMVVNMLDVGLHLVAPSAKPTCSPVDIPRRLSVSRRTEGNERDAGQPSVVVPQAVTRRRIVEYASSDDEDSEKELQMRIDEIQAIQEEARFRNENYSKPSDKYFQKESPTAWADLQHVDPNPAYALAGLRDPTPELRQPPLVPTTRRPLSAPRRRDSVGTGNGAAYPLSSARSASSGIRHTPPPPAPLPRSTSQQAAYVRTSSMSQEMARPRVPVDEFRTYSPTDSEQGFNPFPSYGIAPIRPVLFSPQGSPTSSLTSDTTRSRKEHRAKHSEKVPEYDWTL